MSDVAQGSRYVSTALLSALSDWLTFEALHRVGGFDPVLAQSASRLVGGVVAFGLHKGWTYGAKGLTSISGEVARFLQLYLFSYALSLGLLWLGADVIRAPGEAAKLLADTACFILNFFAMKLWVFRHSVDDQLAQADHRESA